MEHEEELSLLALLAMPDIGPVRAETLMKAVGSARKVWDTRPEVIAQHLPGLPASALSAWHSGPDWRLARWRQERMHRLEMSVLRAGMAGYPAGLNRLKPAPPIFMRGQWSLAPENGVAIVGTRKPTRFGQELARGVVVALVSGGYGVISGMARGIDTAAHQAALEVDGYSAAVLGCGADVAYPSSNAGLLKRLAETGAVFSEFLPGTLPQREHFPRRNRLISALSKAVVVIEAGVSSGSLHTAAYAFAQGLPVFIPSGATGPEAEGLEALKEAGARVFTSPEDLLRALAAEAAWKSPASSKRNNFSKPKTPEHLNQVEFVPNEFAMRLDADLAVEEGHEVCEAFSNAQNSKNEKSNTVVQVLRREGPLTLEGLSRFPRFSNSFQPETKAANDSALLRELLRLELEGQVRRLPGPAFAAVA